MMTLATTALLSPLLLVLPLHALPTSSIEAGQAEEVQPDYETGAATARGIARADEAILYTVETFSDVLNGGSGGMSVDPDGNVYVADFGETLGSPGKLGDKVFKITPEGVASIYATGMVSASGNELDDAGVLYQSNIAGGFIAKIETDGSWTVFAQQGIQGPVGIVIDDEGSLLVANCGNNTIQKVTIDGTSTLFAQSALLRCPNGITKDDDGNFYVANFGNGRVLKITPAGLVTSLAIVPGNNNGHLTYHDGDLYVVARARHQIYKVTLDGQVSLFAGTGQRGRHDGPASTATFSFPNDIVVGPDGSFYVNDVVPHTGPQSILAPMIVRRIRPVHP